MPLLRLMNRHCVGNAGELVALTGKQTKHRRDGRAAEGAPLLREYGLTPIEGSNPSLSAIMLT